MNEPKRLSRERKQMIKERIRFDGFVQLQFARELLDDSVATTALLERARDALAEFGPDCTDRECSLEAHRKFLGLLAELAEALK